jgi:NAD(P)-dependent dehydrogenase (short-subunit alcohol dehydrogenase family)
MSRTLFDLSGRVAVVTGGASGLGLAITRALADFGATVVPCGRRRDAVESACKSVQEAGGKAMAETADVGRRESLDVLRETVLSKLGRVDILVNAAGKTFRKPTVAVSDAEWSDLMDTNLAGTLRACQSFYEPLKASGRGRVVNIASLGSFTGLFEATAYCASKAAVLSLTRSLAIEWARDQICVNAIAPGVFPTDLNRKLIEGTPRGNEFIVRTPMKRFGKAEELGGTAVLLASDAASFMTGTCIAVDGGYLASGVNQ